MASPRPSAETTVPVTDEGFLRGDGAFEVCASTAARRSLLDEHLDRMERSAGNLRLEGVPRADFEREAAELLAHARRRTASTAACAWSRRAAGRRLLITEPLPPPPERLRLRASSPTRPRGCSTA